MNGSPAAECSTPTKSRRELAALLGVVALLVAIFLREPWLGFADHTFSGADLLADYKLLKPEPPAKDVANRVLRDTAIQMQPWMRFATDEVRAGRVPLWNPYNGAGVPHVANYQSAVFSPFSLPFYLFGFKTGVLLAATLKLIVAGLFTARFLRELGCSRLAALLGATAFAFSGQMVVLLAYPHSGVNALLPAMLYFAERACGAFERAAPRREFARALVGFALASAAAACAGHPEPFAFVLLLTGAWIVVRVARAWRTLGGDARAGRRAMTAFGALVGAGLLAGALSAPQWLPFAEYLVRSTTYASRPNVVEPGLERYWPLQMFPTALGMPGPERELALTLPEPNFEQATSAHAGGVALFLALLGACAAFRFRRARFFAVVAGLWALLSCNAFGLGDAYASSRLLGHYAPFYRGQAAWLFSVAVLAAFGLDALRTAPQRARFLAAFAWIAVGAAVLALAHHGAVLLREPSLAKLADARRLVVAAHLAADERWSAVCFAAAILAGAVCCASRATFARRVAAGVVVLAAFTQSAGLLARYNPTTEDRCVYPTTPSLAALQKEVGDGRVVFLQDNGIPPDANVAHRLATLQNYDALGVQRYELLYSEHFGGLGGNRDVTRASTLGLKLFGIEWLLGAGEWAPIATARSETLYSRAFSCRPLEPLGANEVKQTFTCAWPGLRSVAVLLACEAGTRPARSVVHLRLADADSGEVVDERDFDAKWLRREGFGAFEYAFGWKPFPIDVGWHFRQARLEFAPRLDSGGRRYVLACSWSGEPGNHATRLWTMKGELPEPARLEVGGEPRAGALVFDWRRDQSFVETASIAPFTLFRFADALGPYFSVSRAAHAFSAAQSLSVLEHKRFDPYRIVILEDDPDANPVELPSFEGFPEDLASALRGARAHVLERNASSVRLEVERDEPGWLVACQTYFPGWKATVDGREARVLCANHAFQAVEVPAGKSVVELRYEPDSFRRGVFAALGALVVGLAWWAVTRSRAVNSLPSATSAR
ncbi:MAG: YfhO family protein [Planctomycetes bacterium]|nr:YfhO family protein [Planctomycetota bacterium]